jgi:hypothetical protein
VTHPAVDVVTEQVAVVLQQRPVVGFTAWLADAVRLCAQSGRGLQVVTPAGSRLTAPLRLVLQGPDTRWVVRDGDDAYYDGLSGRWLHWDGTAFVPKGDVPEGEVPEGDVPEGEVPEGDEKVAAAFLRPAPGGQRQLVVSLRVRHEAVATTTLGGAVGELCVQLTGAEPRGWGTAEPATQPWNVGALTALVRRRAPRSTWLVVVGGGDRPAVGTMRVARVPSGVDESVTLVVGYGGEVPLATLRASADAIARQQLLVSLLAQVRPGRSDTTWEPLLGGLPVPVGMAVGPEGIDELGLEHALAAPVTGTERIGERARPTVWFPLGDARSAAGWERLHEVMRHLRLGTAQ